MDFFNADWKNTARDVFRKPGKVVKLGDRYICEKYYKSKVMGIDPDGMSLRKVRVVVEKMVISSPAFHRKISRFLNEERQ